ncbi:hypothetical protein BN1723_010511 [Verticillium longisporum]|uniref:Uncharacterized protein n=1 Tax=Verticillium longisporum TaxID=100787 RepID=A0A0G4KZE5_VERLO|nr:hypothetical protein BN1723_010511 [Verticillium longisporum]
MVQPSTQASNAVIFVTYSLFLLMGLGMAYRYRHDLKGGFLSAIPVALNFIASGLGSSVLFAYPELATITGVQGVIVYALSSSLPLLIFAALGSIIRRKTPEGFVLTEWTRQRYGTAAMLYLSAATLFTLFLYLTAELSAIGQVVTTLTGVNQLPVMLVQVAVTTIYTSLGGFKISFVTDNIQGGMVICLIVIAAATIGALTDIDTSLIRESEFLKPTLLGWQLLYILPVCILTNNFFLSNYWLRAFASKTDKDLWIGVSLATTVILCVLVLVGMTGCIAVWSGALPLDEVATSGSVAFFILLDRLPSWVIGVVLVMVVTMSCSAFDTLQSAMVSSASNDLFRNRLNIWWIRAGILLIIIPAIVIALEAPSVLQIYLISDLVSACIVPRILFIAGGFDDARLLLPGWVSIATALTLCYHITQRKINIRKETSTSINIFSIASFVSMVALLAHLHTSRLDYPDAPLLHIVRACRQYWAQMVGENDGDLDAKCEL